ncbi:hypothetical protein V6N11_018803 [Hibiscus sabdariffa]|uniref:Uncharacterized protein n=1 Tax=Hibiscus sabdariffa TaxID=183260 RepID=A0ABR2QTP1_9ROSI
MVRSMMSHNDLLNSFWGHALETATFTLNCVPSKSVQKTPHEVWTGKHPSMSFMKKHNRCEDLQENAISLRDMDFSLCGDIILMDQDEPKTYQEAVSSPDSEKWLEAMRS